jgi:hypothetical protein
LWCLSTKGVLWQVSPFNTHATSFELLGEGIGKSPFIIREILTRADGIDWMPYILAANSQLVKGVNLLTKEMKVFARVPGDEHILSSFLEGFVTLEADSQTAFFLKKCHDQVCLVSCDLLSGETREYDLGEPTVAGPFRIGDQIGVYSERTLYILKNGGIQSYPLLKDFRAWIASHNVKDLQPPAGRMPVVVSEGSVYIPGVVNNVPHLLYASIRESSVEYVGIQIQGEASYTQDAEGRLLVVRDGEMVTYEGINPILALRDGELQGTGTAYYENPLAVGFSKSAGGFESIRFHWGHAVVDYPTANLDGVREGMALGFLSTAGSVIFAYLTALNQMRMVVWHG